jgi:hypothetical protein
MSNITYSPKVFPSPSFPKQVTRVRTSSITCRYNVNSTKVTLFYSRCYVLVQEIRKSHENIKRKWLSFRARTEWGFVAIGSYSMLTRKREGMI